MKNSTTTLNPETDTIGEIVADNYHTAGVFKQYGLDFCCGGGISLKKACEKKKIDIGDVINELTRVRQGRPSENENFKAWQPDYLIDYIVDTHHRFVRQKIDEIPVYSAKVARVHGDQYPENRDIHDLFLELSKEMMSHLAAEEERVFPLIREIYKSRFNGTAVTDQKIGELKKELQRMEEEHEGAGGLMSQIRKLSHDFTPPAGACTTYRILYQNLAGFEEDLHKHIHLENNILFKKAEELLA